MAQMQETMSNVSNGPDGLTGVVIGLFLAASSAINALEQEVMVLRMVVRATEAAP